MNDLILGRQTEILELNWKRISQIVSYLWGVVGLENPL